jgi:prepilin-type N-terminal cleavage/methylation domain-containing protein/prepilin-type processing-associated H-X9-DG protein
VRKGFSLVELLVVMTIISITVAILFPVYAKTRERAWRTACTAHLRQVGIAVAQYVQDSDGIAPPAGPYIAWDLGHPRYGQGWLQRVYPYVEDLVTYRCPTNSIPVFGYSMNGWTMSHLDASGGVAPGPYALDQADTPSETPWLFDAYNPATEGAPEWAALADADCDPDNANSRFHRLPYQWCDLRFPGVHSEGNNLYFLDGHGRWWAHFPKDVGDNDMDAQLAFFEGYR